MQYRYFLVVATWILVLSASKVATAVDNKRDVGKSTEELKMKTAYDFNVTGLDGRPTSLEKFKGNVALFVNTASECGYTPQYEGLEKLYLEFKDKGFVVLGFPSNDFGGQEPGTNEEIKSFCSTRYNVTFPMFAKSKVKGSEKIDVYQHLISDASDTSEEIKWNFEKFLVDKSGKVIKRFPSRVAPDSSELREAILALLNN
jgi:glutathione peroxidase